jgi:acyl carrier protein
MVPLPTYPFARERYWLSPTAAVAGETVTPTVLSPAATAAPRTELERVVASAWENVLGIADITVRDRFLDIGGNSVTAVQIVNRLRDHFDVEVPLSVFIGPDATVCRVAVQVVAELARGEGEDLLDHYLALDAEPNRDNALTSLTPSASRV